ncbi:MAG: hypothetical protein ACK5UX_05360, partial [Burkholderiales bacterium]
TKTKRAGVSQASLIRFERTGEISPKSLVNTAIALEAEAEFCGLFTVPDVPTVDELVAARKNASAGGSESLQMLERCIPDKQRLKRIGSPTTNICVKY